MDPYSVIQIGRERAHALRNEINKTSVRSIRNPVQRNFALANRMYIYTVRAYLQTVWNVTTTVCQCETV